MIPMEQAKQFHSSFILSILTKCDGLFPSFLWPSSPIRQHTYGPNPLVHNKLGERNGPSGDGSDRVYKHTFLCRKLTSSLLISLLPCF